MKSESEVRAAFIRSIRPFGATIQAIESGGTGNGIPDVFVQYQGASAWIEFKIGAVRSERVEIKFRPGQLAWMNGYEENGGVAILGIYLEETNKYYFIHGVSNMKESYAFPFTEWNLLLHKVSAEPFLRWLIALDTI